MEIILIPGNNPVEILSGKLYNLAPMAQNDPVTIYQARKKVGSPGGLRLD